MEKIRYTIPYVVFDDGDDPAVILTEEERPTLSRLEWLLYLFHSTDNSELIGDIESEHPGWLTVSEIKLTDYGMVMESSTHRVEFYRINGGGQYPYGRICGFPSCCIDYFNGMEGDAPTVMLGGTGYVPCPECRKREEQELVSAVNAARLAPHPFPDEADIESFVLCALLDRKGIEHGDNLKALCRRLPDYDYTCLIKPSFQ